MRRSVVNYIKPRLLACMCTGVKGSISFVFSIVFKVNCTRNLRMNNRYKIKDFFKDNLTKIRSDLLFRSIKKN